MDALLAVVAGWPVATALRGGGGGARGDREWTQSLLGLGARYRTIGSDFGYLRGAAKPDVAAGRAMAP